MAVTELVRVGDKAIKITDAGTIVACHAGCDGIDAQWVPTGRTGQKKYCSYCLLNCTIEDAETRSTSFTLTKMNRTVFRAFVGYWLQVPLSSVEIEVKWS